jgi:hypothetical protein
VGQIGRYVGMALGHRGNPLQCWTSVAPPGDAALVDFRMC